MKRIHLALLALTLAFSIHADATASTEPRAVVERVYTLFAAGDMEGFAALMAPDIVWNEAEGNPYADLNPYIGPEAVMSGLMSRFVNEWQDISVTPHEFVVEGDRVVVFGRYGETWKATGQVLDIPFVHSWTVQDGRLVAFQQYTDTAALVATMAGRATPAAQSRGTDREAQPAYRTGNPDDWPPELDAVIAAPGNHKILLENDRVRMLEVTVSPGEVEPLHHHRWPSVLYFQSAGDFLDLDAEENTIFDSRQLDAPLKLPLAMWKEPEAPHSVVNLSDDTAIRLIRVEIKTPPVDHEAAGADLAQGSAPPFEQVALFPADRSLARPEDGVMLADGTLLVADQVHGLVALAPDGAKRPFGDFAAAGYVHKPPERSAGPNGVAMEPDGIHVLVADVLTGAIYRVNTDSEMVERIHQHEFGANSARRDRTGALWFTQSTENNGPDSEARMFAAVDTNPLDGAVFRIAPSDDHVPYPEPERKVSGLAFANGLVIDEVRNQLYVAETMADRIIGYHLSTASGTLSDARVVAELPTPDNIELDAAGRLWVASPIANALLVVDPDTGEWSTAFRPQTPEHERLMIEWKRRTESGEPRLELFGPAMWSPLPGLITGLILTNEGGPIYLTGLGDSLVKLDRLPDPVEAGWHGASICEVLHDDVEQRVLRCTFPPSVGHERHYHDRHFGYVLAGGRMQIKDKTGTRVVELAAGDHFTSDGVDWHEVVNIGDSTSIYLITEPK